MRASFLAFASASLLLLACSGSSSSDVLGPAGASSGSGGPGTGTTTTPTDPADPNGPNGPGDNDPTDPPKTDPPPSKPPATTSPPATAADCDAFAAKYCAKADVCDALLTKLLGTDCADRVANVCKGHIGAPGTGFTTAALTACGNAFAATATCEDAFGAAQIAACSFKGSLPTGTACAFGEQCASGYCTGSDDNTCGKCETSPVAPTTAVAGLGEACDYNGGPSCNSNLGLWCDSATEKCEEMSFVGLGQACGFVGDDLVMCGPGGTCNWGAGGSGTCLAQKAIGAACTAASGYEECTFGSTCIGGKCAYPTAAAICK